MSRRATLLGLAALVALAACSAGDSRGRRGAGPVSLSVGVLFTTAGRGGDFASAALGAANLAMADAARRFAVRLRIVDADYGGDVRRVAGTMRSLQRRTDAVVVATDDPDILPALAPFDDEPVVHALASKDGVVRGREMVFRVAPSDALQARKIAEYLVGHRRYKRVALITDTTTFGRDGAANLRDAFAEEGELPVVDDRFTPGGDIQTPVAHAMDERADVVVLWVESPGEAARVVVESHRMGATYQMVLSGNLATATFAKNASAQVTPVAFRDGMLSVGTWAGPWFRTSRILSFYSRFRTENSALAPTQAASVYDAVLALAAAAEQEGAVQPDSLAAGLESLVDFEGGGVPLTFGPDKHEGIDLDDLAMLGFTKDQDSAGGDFQPEVDTGGGFFTIVAESLRLPDKYRYLQAEV